MITSLLLKMWKIIINAQWIQWNINMNQHFIHLLYSYYFLLLSYQALLGYCTRYYYYENILTIQSKLLFLTLCEKTAVQFSTICKVCVDVAGSSPQKSRIHFCLWTSSCSPVSVLSPLSHSSLLFMVCSPETWIWISIFNEV